jgi:hypothetical protein
MNFARLLSSAQRVQEVGPVKIALIDDGVDASLEILDGKIAAGISFRSYANSGDLVSAYYISSSNHGTHMATVICRLCPSVSLYVAKLDERGPMEGGLPNITVDSAAKVGFCPSAFLHS